MSRQEWVEDLTSPDGGSFFLPEGSKAPMDWDLKSGEAAASSYRRLLLLLDPKRSPDSDPEYSEAGSAQLPARQKEDQADAPARAAYPS